MRCRRAKRRGVREQAAAYRVLRAAAAADDPALFSLARHGAPIEGMVYPISRRPFDGTTPLLLCVECGKDWDASATRLLLRSGANHARRCGAGWTALMLACMLGQSTVVAQLLRAECEVDLQDDNGCTALHHAACNGRESIVSLLVQAGADKALRTHRGRTALDLASRRFTPDDRPLLFRSLTSGAVTGRAGSLGEVAGSNNVPGIDWCYGPDHAGSQEPGPGESTGPARTREE